MTLAKSLSRVPACAAVLLFAASATAVVSEPEDAESEASSKPRLQAEFDDKGLASLMFDGHEMLVHRRVRVGMPTLVDAEGNETRGRGGVPHRDAVSFDPEQRCLTLTYDWGAVFIDYEPEPAAERLGVRVMIRNDSAQTLRQAPVFLGRLSFPSELIGTVVNKGVPLSVANREQPPVIRFRWDGGTMALCGESVTAPVVVGMTAPRGGEQARALRVGLRERNSVFEHEPGEIAPGETREIAISLRFGEGGASYRDLAPDILDAYAERYPRTLHWPDRRPIARLFLAHANTGWETNPQGWIAGKDMDVTTEEGRAAFESWLFEKMVEPTIETCKRFDAQGVIVWDVNGQEMPHPISWLGDPRVLPEAAPEMDAVADRMFERFREADLRVGITIRPTDIVPSDRGKWRWKHVEVKDPAELMIKKIAYAKQRWGCTLYYLDSTVAFETLDDGRKHRYALPASAYRRITEAHPDVLLMPEYGTPLTWAYAAPYRDLRWAGRTPSLARDTYPDAFSVYAVEASKLERHTFRSLAGDLARGDVAFISHSWFDSKDNQALRRIMDLCGELEGDGEGAVDPADDDGSDTDETPDS